MSKEDVNKSLEALHIEIDKLETPDATVKEKLLSLINDIEKQLQNPDSADHKGAAVAKLPTLIEQFESDHPQLTGTLGRLLTTLSGMGV
jgi:HEAT repeat protein